MTCEWLSRHTNLNVAGFEFEHETAKFWRQSHSVCVSLDIADPRSAATIGDYDAVAAAYHDGNEGHDVSQNVAKLIDACGGGGVPLDILDVGCAGGRDLAAFTRLGHRAVGVEGSAAFVGLARRNAPQCTVLQQDLTRLSVPRISFDGIFANAVLFHIPRDRIDALLWKLYSALRPGGVFFASNAHGFGEDREGWTEGRTVETRSWVCWLSESSWKAHCVKAGFVLEDLYYRPPGLPRERQPFLATVWRRPDEAGANEPAPPPINTTGLFLKRVVPSEMEQRSLAKWRTMLKSTRREARFYRELAPRLRRVVRIPHCFGVFGASDPGIDDVDDDSAGDAVLRSGFMLMLERFDVESGEYAQRSPLTERETKKTLELFARMHAAAWGAEEMLNGCERACFWTLSRRGMTEAREMLTHWPDVVRSFRECCPAFFDRPAIRELAERLLRASEWVDAAIADDVTRFKTLVHGDAKAMNVFLKGEAEAGGHEVVPIDFQWTGVGLGAEDVAYHLLHSGPIYKEALPEGGFSIGECELLLLRHYHGAFLRRFEGDRQASSFPFDTFLRQYKLSVLNYARVVFSCFLRGASPASFADKADNLNVSMVYRNIQAFLRFVDQCDRILKEFEPEFTK